MALLMAGAYLPQGVSMLYAIASTAAFFTYGMDKSAAQRGDWRIGERVLHFISFIGGWPGAYLGQQVFRHKTQKTSFLFVYWVTVAINCVALGYLFLWPAMHV